MLHFCTYFDRNYLSRGLALLKSLEKHAGDFRLFVLCMDDAAFDSLARLRNARMEPIRLADLEAHDAELAAVKGTRSKIEYYFTCTPSLPLFILEKHPDVNLITYLDADLFFFADPQPLFEELGDGSVGIIGHRFPPRLKDRERYGLYNVGWLNFRRDERGLACLRWWRERCIEWCFDREDAGRFADQKYLDDWPTRFPGVVVIQHEGANVAPWNVEPSKLRLSGDNVLVGNEPLIFFHFHGLKQIGRWVFDPAWKEYGVEPSALLRRRVYLPYMRALAEVSRTLLRSSSRAAIPSGVRFAKKAPTPASPLRKIAARMRAGRHVTREIAAGTLIFFVKRFAV